MSTVSHREFSSMMLGVKGFGDRHVEYSMGEGEIFVFTKEEKDMLNTTSERCRFHVPSKWSESISECSICLAVELMNLKSLESSGSTQELLPIINLHDHRYSLLIFLSEIIRRATFKWGKIDFHMIYIVSKVSAIVNIFLKTSGILYFFFKKKLHCQK